MFIQDSAVDLLGRHSASQRHEVHESLRIRTAAPPAADSAALGQQARIDMVSISIEARYVQMAYQQSVDDLNLEQLSRDQLLNDPKNLIKILLLEALTGERINFSSVELRVEINTLQFSAASGTESVPGEGFGLAYDYRETYIDEETTTFNASGTVRLASGETINFATELMLHREFRSTTEVSIRIGEQIDPLAINFNGGAVELSGERFAFDLNADGNSENIASLADSSAFLALDRNADGVINDGSELFGPTSGQGFAELAAYDDDGNGWIDEADRIYSDLRFWNPASSELSSMKAHDVGAIYLDAVDTPFMMLNEYREAEALVRSSTVYLKESGSAGTIQQIDLLT